MPKARNAMLRKGNTNTNRSGSRGGGGSRQTVNRLKKSRPGSNLFVLEAIAEANAIADLALRIWASSSRQRDRLIKGL